LKTTLYKAQTKVKTTIQNKPKQKAKPKGKDPCHRLNSIPFAMTGPPYVTATPPPRSYPFKPH
jgi:hypothetical protein